jgi:ABC-type multidrug transport system fused ATPase/permease subunit
MVKFLSKFLYVLQYKYKSLSLLVGLFLLVSLLETLGLAAIGPFISVATKPNEIVQNYWLNFIYTNLHLSSREQFLLIWGILVLITFYIKSFLGFKSQKHIFDFSFRQHIELSTKLMHLYLKAPYVFHLNRNSAFLIQNVLNETWDFINGLMIPLLVSISNTAIVLTLVLLLILTNATATLIVSLVLLIAFLIVHSFKDKLANWGKEKSASLGEMIRFMNHGLGGLKETRIIGCESYFENQFVEQAQKFGRSVSLSIVFSSLPRYVVEACLITFLVLFTFVFLATSQDKSQNLSSVLGVFALTSIRLLPATGNLLSAINGIRYNTISLDKLYHEFKELENVEIKTSSTIETSRQQIIPLLDNVVLKDISYCYPNSHKKSIDGISLEIRKGQSIGLIGKSGAGKTTLVDLILGLLIPQEGDIKIDGKSIYKNLRFWQNSLGYVPQSIFLLDDTIERNIAFGVTDIAIDRHKLNRAIEAAQLTELIEQLPNGLQTMVGERGVLLSGGQRQRVGIARALYHEREILVFDEATAALDNETESLVTESIKALSGIKTMIIIAHRLSTVEHCDRIYMLANGRVVKFGSYNQVVLQK